MRLWAGFGVLMLVACSPPPETHTVAYYQAHAAERDQVLQECNDDPGRLESTPNCINAGEAARIDGVGSLKDLPSLGLPGKH